MQSISTPSNTTATRADSLTQASPATLPPPPPAKVADEKPGVMRSIPGEGLGGLVRARLMGEIPREKFILPKVLGKMMVDSLCISPNSLPKKQSVIGFLRGKETDKEFIEIQNKINLIALRAQWAYFIKMPHSIDELNASMVKNLFPLCDSISDPKLKEKANSLILSKIEKKEEKQYLINPSGAIFLPKGTNLRGPVYQTTGRSIFYVPEKIDKKMLGDIFRKTGIQVKEGENLIGRGEQADIKIALQLKENRFEIVAAKFYGMLNVGGGTENAIYDLIDPENQQVLSKKGFCAPPGNASGVLFLEFAIGGNCEDMMGRILKNPKLSSSQKDQLVATILQGCTTALWKLHNNHRTTETGQELCPISHADVKLENFFLVKRDGIYHVVISDLGAATTRREGIRSGTPLYLPPEYRNKDAETRPADIYALGKVYEIAAGKLPAGDSKRQLNSLSERMKNNDPLKRELPDVDKEPYFKEKAFSNEAFSTFVDFLLKPSHLPAA